MGIVIKVENLGKKYIISHQQERYTALRDVMANTAKEAIKKVIGRKEINPKKEEFWALRNVDFEVNAGDRIGIIGRNGAGKSTLLKLLSKITEPTEGKIKIKGKIASLLEVGTGFHPELTGKENIMLNGAILGMSKKEILKKFDDIVTFSGVEKFLDTPVKRYSSGMYVRLAFAVAAHLETEILLIDEVLAVGDIEFQKKCIGRMDTLSKEEGRTIIFVSHNMGAISQLCTSCLLMNKGKISLMGDTKSIIAEYLGSGITSNAKMVFESDDSKLAQFDYICVLNKDGKIGHEISDIEPVTIEIGFSVKCNLPDIYFGLVLQNVEGVEILFADSRDGKNSFPKKFKPGEFLVKLIIPPLLSFGKYYVSLGLAEIGSLRVLDSRDLCYSFELVNLITDRTIKRPGFINLYLDWILL